MDATQAGQVQPESELLAEALKQPLLDIFPAALLGRLVVIPYYPLSSDMLKRIVKLQLGRIEKRIQQNHGISFEYNDDVVQLIVNRCKDVESGGRMIDAILTNTLLPRISHEYLTRLSEGDKLAAIHVTVAEDDFAIIFN